MQQQYRSNASTTKSSACWGDADLIELMTRRSPVRDQRGRLPPSSSSRPRSANRTSDRRDIDRQQHSDYDHHQEDDYDYDREREENSRRKLKRRSQSLGQRMTKAVTTTPRQRELAPPPTLNLYHVSRPEPRARWVFNLSKHTNVVDNGPPPDTVTSSIDKARPSLGGLVWVNAALGNNHCCLQKGLKTKTVTPVPAEVLDGWLNGQTGFWWIGALKEGHRSLWDSHVVMGWAMVFIPSSPEVAARNNMEVWRDKCLKGSLRVARPGELARKIIDIVADDQDAEPESVVHTHLCILLAEGDDLELKRPKMFSASTPRNSTDLPPTKPVGIKHSVSLGAIDGGVVPGSPSNNNNNSNGAGGGPVDLSQVTLENGTPKLRASPDNSEGGGAVGAGGERKFASAPGGTNQMSGELEEAMGKVERYRERILILKQDRHAKKAMLAQLKEELRDKEDVLTAENERLREERDEIKERAKVLWMDVENLRGEIEKNSKNITEDEAKGLHAQVERLRRERNDARADAMRWLEDQHRPHQQLLPGPSPAGGGAGGDSSALTSISRGLNGRTPSASSFSTANGGGGSVVEVDLKAAAAIAKLKSKVERLRKERDDAEKHAASWLRSQQRKLARGQASALSSPLPEDARDGETGVVERAFEQSNNSNGVSAVRVAVGSSQLEEVEGVGGGAGGGGGGGGPVVASLRAESLRLKNELQLTKEEARRWKQKAAAHRGGSGGGGSSGSGFDLDYGAEVGAAAEEPLSSATEADDDEEEEEEEGHTAAAEEAVVDGRAESKEPGIEKSGVEARKALGKLLGQALNLLDPTAAATTTTPPNGNNDEDNDDAAAAKRLPTPTEETAAAMPTEATNRNASNGGLSGVVSNGNNSGNGTNKRIVMQKVKQWPPSSVATSTTTAAANGAIADEDESASTASNSPPTTAQPTEVGARLVSEV